jgi:hypothetical protein
MIIRLIAPAIPGFRIYFSAVFDQVSPLKEKLVVRLFGIKTAIVLMKPAPIPGQAAIIESFFYRDTFEDFTVPPVFSFIAKHSFDIDHLLPIWEVQKKLL